MNNNIKIAMCTHYAGTEYKKKMAKLFNGKLENWKYKELSEVNQVCKKLIKFLNL